MLVVAGGGGSKQKDLKSMLKSGGWGKTKQKKVKAGDMPTLVTAPPKKKAKVKPQVADIF